MQINTEVRVRFAPSPTGELHVGGARTALFNWLFARHYGGKFILRIEDTDQVRSTAESLGGILKSLRWLGLDWDEGPEVGGEFGPYFQMQRLNLYREAAYRLLEEGKAYRCYCTPQELKERREAVLARGEPPHYDRRCRDPEYRKTKAAEGRKPAVRIAMPLEGETVVADLVRGEVKFANSELEDFVLLRSDGIPTYNFAVVIDDIAMHISHVIRAEEHLANTPKQIQVYQALRAPIPYFAHVSILLAADRTKLSKRHEASAVHEFAKAGYLPEAMVNYLALLGWSYDDKTELFSKEELIKHFILERVVPSPAIFSYDKLQWMNGVYIRGLKPQDLASRLKPFLEEAGIAVDRDTVRLVTPLVQERIKTLSEASPLVDFFFREEIEYDGRLLLGKGIEPAIAERGLQAAREALVAIEPFAEAEIEARLRALAEKLGLKSGEFFGILRVAATGKTVAPPLFATMAVLGRERVLARIDFAWKKLATLVPQSGGG